MQSQVATTHGTLNADGTLSLDEQLSLSPGRVQVTVQPLPVVPANDPFWQRMQAIWNAQNASSVVPRSAEAIEAQTRAIRDEWEERSKELEQRGGH